MFQLNKKLHFTSISMIVIGLLSLVIGFMSDAHSTWTNLLFNNYFFLGISLFAVVFVAIQYVAEAGWSTVFKRVPEAMMAFFLMRELLCFLLSLLLLCTGTISITG